MVKRWYRNKAKKRIVLFKFSEINSCKVKNPTPMIQSKSRIAQLIEIQTKKNQSNQRNPWRKNKFKTNSNNKYLNVFIKPLLFLRKIIEISAIHLNSFWILLTILLIWICMKNRISLKVIRMRSKSTLRWNLSQHFCLTQLPTTSMEPCQKYSILPVTFYKIFSIPNTVKTSSWLFWVS